MKYIIKILSFVVAVISLFTFCGCGEQTSSAIIYYGLETEIKNLDPQTADSPNELMVIRNIFEGLLRENQNGEIVNGVITNYKKDGLTYTFNINADAVWNDDTPLTAEDFVFAFKRAVDPKTAAPNVQCLYSIKNAEKISKNIYSVETLGVRALNEKTLVIELEKEDLNFLYTLTTAICMPCNQNFFNKTVGKYGRDFEAVLCNGSYKLRKWNTENNAIRITMNKSYTGNFVPKNAAVYFSKNKEYNTYETLNKNYVDIAEVNNEYYEKLISSGFNVEVLDNKVLILSIGKKFTNGMRNALIGSALNSADFSEFNGKYKFADTLYPDIFDIENLPKINYYTPENSKSLFSNELKGLKDRVFPTSVITYYNDVGTTDIVKKIAGHWQKNLGLYINIQPKNSINDFSLNNTNYDICVYPIEINDKNSQKYLFNFTNNTSGNAEDIQNRVFFSEYNIPIAFYGTCYAYNNDLTGLKFNTTNGVLDFSYVVKQN